MNLLECTKVNTFFEFTKQNAKIFKKKLFWFCKLSKTAVCYHFCALKNRLNRVICVVDGYLSVKIIDTFGLFLGENEKKWLLPVSKGPFFLIFVTIFVYPFKIIQK